MLTLICKQCRETFSSPARRTIYCSKACYGIAQRKTPEQRRSTRRDYYLANREAILQKSRDHQLAHRDHRRDYLREYHQKLRMRVIAALGGKCLRCGFDDPRALQVDHVHGGGNWELRFGPNAYRQAKGVIADTTGKYQLLCANCNWIKKHDNEETTKKHKRPREISHPGEAVTLFSPLR